MVLTTPTLEDKIQIPKFKGVNPNTYKLRGVKSKFLKL